MVAFHRSTRNLGETVLVLDGSTDGSMTVLGAARGTPRVPVETPLCACRGTPRGSILGPPHSATVNRFVVPLRGIDVSSPSAHNFLMARWTVDSGSSVFRVIV